ncbi:MAG: hypothetical protein Ta2A_27380 [Treponemataceae bacterium]|nr:MAG: hypothetical protein Ta2A_27380 [Treponemataceae bacterium]
MVFGEWDMGTALKVAKEEGWEEGREEGWENVLELLDEDQRENIKQKLLQNSAYATSHR